MTAVTARLPLLLLAALTAWLLAVPLRAQEAEQTFTPGVNPSARGIVAALSQNRVSITANFSGSQIFVFGAVKQAETEDPAPLEVVITISGPAEPVKVRRKARVAGIWLNADEVLVDEAPSFYAVASTGPLDEVLAYAEDLRYRIGINHLVRLMSSPSGIEEVESFREAVIRLRRDEGLYVELPDAVSTVESTLFTAEVDLPANLVEGDYRARVFLVQDGRVADVYESAIAVRKVGLERWAYTLSREQPALYGLLSIVTALLAGWGASEIFRLMRS